jgi:hypothetical protein
LAASGEILPAAAAARIGDTDVRDPRSRGDCGRRRDDGDGGKLGDDGRPDAAPPESAPSWAGSGFAPGLEAAPG